MAVCREGLDLGVPYAISAAARPAAREEIPRFLGKESGFITDDGGYARLWYRWLIYLAEALHVEQD
jgi:hypothetical protein